MIVKKGQRIVVNHRRKGQFMGMAYKEFDTEDTPWYPITLAQEGLKGYSARYGVAWNYGDKIPCRASIVDITLGS